MKLPIAKEPKLMQGIPWTSCEPFLENSMATLIHRVKHVTTHKIGLRYAPHLSVHLWCNNSTSGTKKFTFLAAPPENKIVCARCEDAAVSAGLPTSEQLAGRHVHTGGVIAVARCCGDMT